MKINELRAKKSALVAQIRALKDANSTLTPEVNSQIDALFAQVDTVSAEISSEDRLSGHEAELRESAGRVPRDNPSAEVRETAAAQRESRKALLARTNRDEYRAALNDYAIRGNEMSAESRALLNSESRALADGTTTAGGFTVPTGFIDQLVIAEKSYGEFLTVCDYLDTVSGNPIQYPLANDTQNAGEITTEAGGLATNQDPTFGQVTLTPDKWDSGIVKVSLELLEDSAFAIDTLLEKFFACIADDRDHQIDVTAMHAPHPIIVMSADGRGEFGLLAWAEKVDCACLSIIVGEDAVGGSDDTKVNVGNSAA